jgi:hypothetical protein
VHPEAAAAANVLASARLRRPDTGAPLSEALVFGIAGGLGALYILWEWQAHDVKVLVLGFHHLGNYPIRYYQGLALRLGARVAMPETGSRKAATAALDSALDAGKAAVAWVDRAYMPYLQMPGYMKAHIGHMVAVCGRENDGYWIDDRAASPYFVDAATFGDARERITSYKQRLLLVESLEGFDLQAAIRAGIAAQIEYLTSDSDSFSLPVLRKWARMLTDTKNKKAYPVAFKDRRGLFSTLRSTFEGVTMSVGEGALRALYARFLREAAAITGDALLPAANAYAALAGAWDAFADAALPDAAFAPFKTLLRERQARILQGGDAWKECAAQTAEIDGLTTAYNRDFPLDDAAVSALFAEMSERMMAIYDAEVRALGLLKGVAARARSGQACAPAE